MSNSMHPHQANFQPPNQQMNTYSQQQPMPYHQNQSHMGQNSQEQQVLSAVNPVIHHGMREAQHLGFPHALKEAVAIAYLMGQGQDFRSAWQTVESWWRPNQPTTFY
ncbi:hypothetical protein ACS127_07945 [Amphibacillus sp. Q70]|uniref:hypothetical protein n=1 Tax=Amphibacillus sp. Q70 TaxID=3453416 RepID=UPI003F849DDD